MQVLITILMSQSIKNHQAKYFSRNAVVCFMKRTYHTNLAIAYNLGILPGVLFFFIAKRKVPKEKLVAGYGFRENNTVSSNRI